MKRSLSITLLTSFVLLAFLVPGSALFAADKPIKLLIGHFEPPFGPYAKFLTKLGKDLEARTNGRIKVTMSLGGALGKPGQFLELVEKGLCDISSTVPAFQAGKFPMSEIIALPYILAKSDTNSKAAWKFYKKGYMDKELSGVKVLAIGAGQGEKLMMPDKPILTVAAMKGKKIWASSATTQQKVRIMGGIPVALPVTDLYPSLQKNVIDGFYGDWAFLHNFKLYEIIKYITVPTNGVMFVITVMNKKKFNSLPADIQAMIEDSGEAYSMQSGNHWDEACDLGKQGFLDRGGKVVTWKKGEREKIEKLWAPIWTKWIEQNEKRGLPAQKAVDDMYNLLKDISGVDPAAIGYRPK